MIRRFLVSVGYFFEEVHGVREISEGKFIAYRKPKYTFRKDLIQSPIGRTTFDTAGEAAAAISYDLTSRRADELLHGKP